MKQVTIDGVNYNIDIEQAKTLGILKPIARELKSGDMYKYRHTGNTVLVIQTGYEVDNFVLIGSQRMLTPYNGDNRTSVEMELYLRQNDYIFFKNVTMKDIN